jgi:hypothetical protein
MTKYMERTAWVKAKAGGDALVGKRLIGVSVHYPGSGSEFLNKLTQAQVISRLNGWREYHMNVRGWSDIGYQMAIDGSGRVWTLRGIGRKPAASASKPNPQANSEWGAVLFIVGNNEPPTPAALEAFRDWFNDEWLDIYPNAKRIVGHGDVPGAATECPGNWLRSAIRSNTLLKPTKPTSNPEELDEMTPQEFLQAKITDDDDKTALTVRETLSHANWLAGRFAADGDLTKRLNEIHKMLTDLTNSRVTAKK